MIYNITNFSTFHVVFQQASYDSCKNVKSGNTEAINLICDSLDCDMDDFYLSLGINKYTDLKVFYEIYNPESWSMYLLVSSL